MTSPIRGMAEGIRAAGGWGASEGAYCYECQRTITPRNRRRGAWCELCESDDGLGRNPAAGQPKKDGQPTDSQ